ncbi:hypothetical protein [Hankyongella ginsenosidimutans]|uniref:hypothetical protein n=1 Tax=Hankyongella ginsenosidimutans TaxID=1763828 RepID=UPI001CA370FB|nr:hypothetical protein [Hankyongella ginsenosidimutans]
MARCPNSATLQIRTGRLDESVRGLTDLFVALMNEGVGGKSAADVARASGDMGGSVGFAGGSDTMSAGISALSEFAGPAIALLADQVRRPNLPESELPRLKQDALRAWQSACRARRPRRIWRLPTPLRSAPLWAAGCPR